MHFRNDRYSNSNDPTYDLNNNGNNLLQQVEGKQGIPKLMAKFKAHGPTVFYHGNTHARTHTSTRARAHTLSQHPVILSRVYRGNLSYLYGCYSQLTITVIRHYFSRTTTNYRLCRYLRSYVGWSLPLVLHFQLFAREVSSC